MNNLGINTPEGQENEELTQKYMQKLVSMYKGWDYIINDDKKTHPFDGFITQHKKLIFAYEAKCRDLTREQMKSFGTWLITYEKIWQGQYISRQLMIPFIGIVFHKRDDSCNIYRITNKYGDIATPFYVTDEIGTTYDITKQRAVNRFNAYFKYEHSKEIF